MAGSKGEPSTGSVCVHSEESRGDCETFYRQGKRISNSIRLLALACRLLMIQEIMLVFFSICGFFLFISSVPLFSEALKSLLLCTTQSSFFSQCI